LQLLKWSWLAVVPLLLLLLLNGAQCGSSLGVASWMLPAALSRARALPPKPLNARLGTGC
jgi:hypothetical protein